MLEKLMELVEEKTQGVGEKERIFTEMRQMKRNGQHREWFEETCCKAIEDVNRKYGFEWRVEIWKECLRENQVAGYTDEDYLKMLVHRVESKDICLYLKLYSKYIVERNLIWNRESELGKAFLDKLIKGGKEWEKMGETLAYYFCSMVCIQVEGKVENQKGMSEEERIVLDLNERELCAVCCKNGFFRKENAAEYLEYCLDKAYWKLVPVFTMLKYEEEEDVYY